MRRFVSYRAVLVRLAHASTALTLLAGGATAARAQSLPVGGTSVGPADATIATGANQVTVTQTSNRGVINWQSFDVAQGNSVVFNQPSATAATLNRVTGGTNSTIAGSISSNGAVYLVNPNGIAITASGSVRTGGGFVASTLDIADADFLSGNLAFTGKGASGRVANAGTITVGSGGYAALIGGSVSNNGTISVPLGRVGLGSGESVALDLSGDGFLRVAVPTAAITGGDSALIEMAGSIAAAGGRVELRSATVKDAVRNVINMGGTISADNAYGDAGSIVLLGGDGGTAHATGTLSAKATGMTGNGGFVETSGAKVDLTGLDVNTSSVGGAMGTWLIDPYNVAIANLADSNQTNFTATGDDSVINSTTLLNALANTNVTVATGSSGTQAGNIILTNGTPLSWTSGSTLTLQAAGAITLNSAITATTGGLTLTAGNDVALTGAVTTGANGTINVGIFNLTNGNWSQTGTLPAFAARDFRFDSTKASFLRVTGGDGSLATPYRIADVYGLAGIASTNLLASNFALAGNIDATGTANWNAGAGFVSIGRNGAFTGSFSGANGAAGGLRFAIDGLYINGAVVSGLFRGLSGSVSDLSLTNASMTTTNNGGGLLAGSVFTGGTVTRVDVAGTRTGAVGNVGGLVGDSTDGIFTDVSANVTVNGGNASNVGGLVAVMTGGSITRGTATGSVTGTGTGYGGLVGSVTNGSVTDSSASGNVSGGANTGGLIGSVIRSQTGGNNSVTNSFATGTVAGGSTSVGGLVGLVSVSTGVAAIVATVPGATYATGRVTASGTYVGGLVGQISVGTTAGNSATITGAYATGNVSTTSASTTSYVGGLVGFATKTGTNNTTTIAIGSSYATGTVASGGSGVGGLVGFAFNVGTTITDSYASGAVTGVNNLGGLVGVAQNGVVINDTRTTGPATASGNVTGSGSVVGGLVGTMNYGSITGARATGTVQGTNSVGGLVGSSANASTNQNMTIANSSATGNVTGSSTGIGGLVGLMSKSLAGTSSIDKSFATGTVTTTVNGNVTANIGGLVGVAQASGTTAGTRLSITSSYATGGVTAPNTTSTASYVGGLIGQATMAASNNLQLDLSDVYATGNVSSRGGTVGGLIGYMVGTVARTTLTGGYATGVIINGTLNIGGLIGNASGVALNSVYATARASGTGGSIGGLVGIQTGGTTINYAYATGPVSGSTNVGGLIGLSDTGSNRLNNAYASNSVSSAGNNVGGLIGQLTGSGNAVTNVYATGSVRTTGAGTAVGGLVGLIATGTSVTSAYASGAVTSGDDTTAGGLAGTSAGTITNAYWDSYSTMRGTAVGSVSAVVPGATVNVVTSDPAQAAASKYAFSPAAYFYLSTPASTGTNLGSATVSGFVTLVGGLRPFLAFEVPLANTPLVTTVAGAQTITNAHQLQLVNYNAATLSGNYALGRPISLIETGANQGTAASSAGMWAGTGFVSLGTDGAGNVWDGMMYRALNQITSGIYGFSGTMNGNGNTLSFLTINRAGVANTGLFGVLSNTVSNMSVDSFGVVKGGAGTGGLVGVLLKGTATTGMVTGSSSNVEVVGGQQTGGLIGTAAKGTSVSASNANNRVTGTINVGGLIGYANTATITSSQAAGAVTGTNYAGGLIGYAFKSTTTNSRATGDVSGTTVGALMGVIDGGSATNSAGNGTVTGAGSADRNYGRITNGAVVTNNQ